MKISQVILTMLLYLQAIFVFGQEDIRKFEISEYDKKLYGDMLHDQEWERFLKVFLNTAHGDLMSLTDYQFDEYDWANSLKERAFPILLEVLKREKNVDYDNQGNIFNGIMRKEALLSFAKKNPQGDLQPFVEEVRRQLPEWLLPEWQNKNDTYTGFIRAALDLLARKGDESDIPLIESFLNDLNGNNRESAKKSLTKLNERLALEAAEKSRVQHGFNSDPLGSRNSTTAPKQENPSPENLAKEKKLGLPKIISGLVLLGIFALLLNIYKGKKESRGTRT